MSYALAMLWHDRHRFFPAVLAVAFSVILICTQFGLLLGMFSLTSIPIDHSRADVWIGSPDVVSIDVGKPIPDYYLTRLAKEPEIKATEEFVLGFQYWQRPDGGSELCIVVGADLGSDSIGAIDQLSPRLRSLLTKPQSIVVDRSELGRLGIKGVGEKVQIWRKQVQVVGLVDGLAGLQGPYVFCSRQTARAILNMRDDQTTYVIGKCDSLAEAQQVAARLKRRYPKMSVLCSPDFSSRSRMHWLTKTKGGIAVGFAAVLGLLVGAAITRQSLYSATIACIREYAVLRAMGVPRWRITMNVVWLSFWIGASGVAVALPIIFCLVRIGLFFHVPVLMPWWLLSVAVVATWLFAIIAGLSTVRSVQQAEPVALLR